MPKYKIEIEGTCGRFEYHLKSYGRDGNIRFSATGKATDPRDMFSRMGSRVCRDVVEEEEESLKKDWEAGKLLLGNL